MTQCHDCRKEESNPEFSMGSTHDVTRFRQQPKGVWLVERKSLIQRIVHSQQSWRQAMMANFCTNVLPSSRFPYTP
jgi:hypothetical protein